MLKSIPLINRYNLYNLFDVQSAVMQIVIDVPTIMIIILLYKEYLYFYSKSICVYIYVYPSETVI